jgi:hypothetical protein
MSEDKGYVNNNNDGMDINKRMRLVGALDDLGFRIRGGHYRDFTVIFGWEDMQVHITGDDYDFGSIDDDELYKDIIEILDRVRDNNVLHAKEERAQRDQVMKRIKLADSEDESAGIRSCLQHFDADINSSSEQELDEEELDQV